MTESELLAEVLLAVSRDNVRLFRSNAGLAWQGRVLEQTPTRLVLAYPRPIKLLAPGFHDTVGWRSIEIQPEHVGRRLAQFATLELKSARGRVTDEQAAFQATVRRAGGLSEVARSVEQARAALEFLGDFELSSPVR